MCGIVGIVGREPVAERLVDALRRLEYRGYDSAGVATIHDGVMDRRRAEGKLFNLEKKLQASHCRAPLALPIHAGQHMASPMRPMLTRISLKVWLLFTMASSRIFPSCAMN